MADERKTEPQEEAATPQEEAATPWRSLRGAARDLSSLFGEQSVEPDPGSSALGSRKIPAAGGRQSQTLDALSRRMEYLERELSQNVSRLQGVDRHVAATFLAVQSILERIPEPNPDETGNAAWPIELGPLAKRLEAIGRELNSAISVVGDRIERMARRLASVEVALAATAERLALTGAPPRAAAGPEAGAAAPDAEPQPEPSAETRTEGEPPAEETDVVSLDAAAAGEAPSEGGSAPFWRPAGAS